MASVNFMKCKTVGEAKAMIRHSETEERLKHEHSNKDIDKSRTSENIAFTHLSYKEVCNKFDERIKTLDETTNTNHRKDRVTCFGLTIPAPAGMSEEQSKVFFYDVIKLMGDKFGTENMLAGYAHYDEIHSYIDGLTGEVQESRPHLHAYVVPKISGKLNGKLFSSKKAMMELNREIDTLCKEKYNCKFLTGEPIRNRTVEELKSISNTEQEKRIREKATLTKQIETLNNNIVKANEQIDHVNSELERGYDKLNEIQEREEAFQKYKPDELTYPEVKTQKMFGKEYVKIPAATYDSFKEEVEIMRDRTIEAKEALEKYEKLETVAQTLVSKNNKLQKENDRLHHDLDLSRERNRELQNNFQKEQEQSRTYKSALEKLRGYANLHKLTAIETYIADILPKPKLHIKQKQTEYDYER